MTGTPPIIKKFLAHAQETELIGQKVAAILVPGMVITLSGELGTGKTTFVRALLHSLGVQGPIKSPTYSLVEVYAISSLYLYHFDLYRFKDPEEWEAAGFREYFRDNAMVFIEWPEKAATVLPTPDWAVTLSYSQASREITIIAKTQRGAACLANLTNSEEPIISC